MAFPDRINFAALMEPVALRLLGEPNKQLTKSRRDTRFGSNGSVSINFSKGAFFDYEAEVGGGVIELIKHKLGMDHSDAVAWLRDEGYLPSHAGLAKTPKVNGVANGKSNGKLNGEASNKADKIEEVEEVGAETVVGTYEYLNESGAVLSAADRIQFKKPDGTFVLKDNKPRKTFRQRRPNPDCPGAWLSNVQGVPVVPYRLPELIEAIASGHPVLIVEGERKVDLLHEWNVAATCCAGGAKKWKPEHSEFLRGADVVLVPDDDNAGWDHANLVGASLVGIAASTRVLVLPHTKPKADIIDWAHAGGTREELDALLSAAPDWKPPVQQTEKPSGAPGPGAPIDEAKAWAKQREDELIAGLMNAEGLEYGRLSKQAAEELSVSRRDIENEVRARREDAAVAPLYGHWEVEPWPDPVEGGSLLRDIIKRIHSHVVISDDHALTVALFVTLGWVHDEVATHSPILNVTSAEPQSGKTTLLSLISFLLPRCIATVEASDAALYRAIERWKPSFVLDEFDDVMADRDKRTLRSIINSGHTRGTGVLRCEKNSNDRQTPAVFETFAPKAIGMIGRNLPPAMLTRCLFVELRRRKRDEPIEKFKSKDDAGLADLRSRLRRWSMDNEDALRDAAPTMPDALWNRGGDNWSLQFAIADLAGEDWGDKVRATAISIEAGADSRTVNARALAAVKTIYESHGGDVISSDSLVQALVADPNSEWHDWKGGKPITQAQLARLLKRYGIRPGQIRPEDGRQVRGYYFAHFVEAWERYT